MYIPCTQFAYYGHNVCTLSVNYLYTIGILLPFFLILGTVCTPSVYYLYAIDILCTPAVYYLYAIDIRCTPSVYYLYAIVALLLLCSTAELQRHRMRPPPKWRQDFAEYIASVPSYYAQVCAHCEGREGGEGMKGERGGEGGKEGKGEGGRGMEEGHPLVPYQHFCIVYQELIFL